MIGQTNLFNHICKLYFEVHVNLAIPILRLWKPILLITYIPDGNYHPTNSNCLNAFKNNIYFDILGHYLNSSINDL